ncbi:PRP38 family domain-containing protein [Ditylenchus destructor]|nr:PRP38 family domain-containing protein [Ditylenchus destructor]
MDSKQDGGNLPAMPSFKDLMGFSAGNDVMYEDNDDDNTIPDIQKITKKNNILPLWGNTQTMNLNTLVLENIVQSTYYKNYLNEVTSFQQIVDEIYYNVSHLEPWERGTRKTQGMTGMCGGVRGVGAGGVISTAFCLLYKMFTQRITRKQLVSMLNSPQSVYLRGLGFMYIRFTQPPPDLWNWMEAYLEDDEEIDPRSGGGDKMTMSQLVRMMLTKLDFYGTLFPRIPVPIQKEIELKFRERAKLYMEEDARYGDKRVKSRSRSRSRRRSVSRDRSRERKRDRDITSKESSDRDRKRPGRHYKCRHHLKHHHCRKHRQHCPSKAMKAAAILKEEPKSEDVSKEENMESVADSQQ